MQPLDVKIDTRLAQTSYGSIQQQKATQSFEEIMAPKVKRKDGTLPKERNIALCSEHFTEDCIERDLKKEFELQSGEQFYKIKENAVPTIFKHTNNSTIV